MLVQTVYPGITLKTQLKRHVNYWCVYNISFLTQLFSILEYYQNLEKKSFCDINYINESVFNLCARSQRMHFISRNSFAVNGSLNKGLVWKDRIHTNKRVLQQLAFNFIKDVRYRRFLNQFFFFFFFQIFLGIYFQ